MMHEEVTKYRELSGDTNPNTPISRIGGYLDGYEKALEQKPCEDTINRKDALMCLTGEIKETDTIETIIARFGRRIRKLPPVTPQSKTGRWIYGEDNLGTGRDGWYCNQCGHFKYRDYSSDMKSAKLNLPNPCPNCGAKMVEPQESEG